MYFHLFSTLFFGLQSILPEKFIKGLATASLQGRAQVVPDQFIESRTSGDLVFYLDGAHSPESMEVCAKWFSDAVKGDNRSESSGHLVNGSSGSSHDKSSVEENCQQVKYNGFLVLTWIRANGLKVSS